MGQLQEQFYALNRERFMETPDRSERKFVEHCGEVVPDEYLANFERALHQIHYVCALAFEAPTSNENPNKKNEKVYSLERFTDVLNFYLFVNSSSRTLILIKVVSRPCAELLGFTRLLLYELARNCLYYGATLVVRLPVLATQDILRKAWPTGAFEIEHGNNVEQFSLTPAQQQLPPARALGVEPLLLLPLEADAAMMRQLIAEFVASQTANGAPVVFETGPQLVDAFLAFAPVRMRPDAILCLFLQQLADVQQRGQWVLWPSRKRAIDAI